MQPFKLFKPHKPPKEYTPMILNTRTFWDYFYRLEELALNVFEWRNLPDSIDERFMELTLIERGYCVYFNDEIMGDLVLPCTYGGELDVYRIPIQRRAYSVNGYQKFLTKDDSVLIFNNYLHTPSIETIILFAKRLAEIERTIDVNVLAQKTPVTILCDKSQELTYKNLYEKAQGNTPVIIGSKTGLDLGDIKALNTSAPYVSDKLNILKRQIWNEALTFLGIENVSSDKRERLVSDEVETNLGAVQAQRWVMLNARQQAVKKINKMFGTNIEVVFKEDNTEGEKEVEEDGEIYD